MAISEGGGKGLAPGRKPLRGRRGGRTTVTPLLVRKTYWIDRDVEELLREDAFRTDRSEAQIVREVLRTHYRVDE